MRTLAACHLVALDQQVPTPAARAFEIGAGRLNGGSDLHRATRSGIVAGGVSLAASIAFPN
jgi:hypothetical protein